MISCFFIGHHDAPSEIIPQLQKAVEEHIRYYGVEEFLVGYYGNFDRMAAATVKLAKDKHKDIQLTLFLPYHPTLRRVELSPGFNGSFYPPGMETVPKRLAIVKANEYAVRHCDFLICYNRNQVGNTRRMVEIAMRRQEKGEMTVTNLYTD